MNAKSNNRYSLCQVKNKKETKIENFSKPFKKNIQENSRHIGEKCFAPVGKKPASSLHVSIRNT